MRKQWRGLAYAGIISIVVVVISVYWLPYHPDPQLLFSQTTLQPGEFFEIKVNPVRPGHIITITADFLKEEPLFFSYDQGKLAFVPVDYRTYPGIHNVVVTLTKQNKTIFQGRQEIVVEPREFAIQRLYVSQELHSLRDEDLWAEDRVWTSQARSTTNKEPLWEGMFILPVDGRITTQFGQIRYINDQESGRHSGLDIAAQAGTPILASNTGVVALARSLHVTGNTVILDHGQNIFTSYGHLEKINVEQNQLLQKGEVLGTVGNTGFSTGPHLHWSVSIGSVFINPETVLK